MERLRSLFGKRKPASPTRGSPPPAGRNQASEKWHFFACSGNPSLIDAHNRQFQAGVRAFHGTAGRYQASSDQLRTREQRASNASLPFVGESYMGSRSTPVSHMREVLSRLAVDARRDIHVAYVSVDRTGVSWVHKVYGGLLDQAVRQGILPYNMYGTQDQDAAKFLLGSLDKVS